MQRPGAVAMCGAMLLVIACDTAPGGSGSVTPGVSVVRIHFAGAGRGTIRSASPAFDCTAECTQTIPAGSRLHLVAIASAGSTFGAWTGPCSGSADCDFTALGNPDVMARFDIAGQPPPIQGQLVVDVQINGQGAVTSTPPGIDCGSNCHAPFSSAVELTPKAQAGFHFDGWGGACTGSGACKLSAPAGDAGRQVTVFATFVADQPPPPPSTDCVDIVPAQLGPSVSATVSGGVCDNQTSDGQGNVAADTVGHWFIFSAAGQQLGDYVAETAIPQDRGFQGVEVRGSGTPPSQALVFRNPDGTSAAQTTVGSTGATHAWRVSGEGSVVISQICGGKPPGGIDVIRFDGNGKLSSRGSIPGGCSGGFAVAAGEAGGSTLVLLSGGRNVGLGADVVGRWIDSAGNPQTDFFAVASGARQGAVRALIGGSVALQLDGTWIGTVANGSTKIDAPPQWLTENASHDFTIVRNRRAYALLPRGSGNENVVTLYSAQGNRCGTVTFPVGGITTGVDGTAIGASGAGGCTKTWWPGLLR
jgi:Divergent InlB B-repeat domain